MSIVPGDPSADDPPSGVDLDDVSNCPRGPRCESCGDEDPDVSVYSVATRLGVICLSLCPRCAASSVEPPLHIGTVARLVAQHTAHVKGVASP